MKKFFRKIGAFLNNLFTNLDEWIHVHVQPSIETIQRLKAIVSSPVADVITALIPGDADDKFKAWLQVNLDKAIDTVVPVAQLIGDAAAQPTLEEKILKLIEGIKAMSPSMQKGMYLRLASEMAISSGGKDDVKGHSVDLLTQMQYSKLAENVNADDLEQHCDTCGSPQ